MGPLLEKFCGSFLQICSFWHKTNMQSLNFHPRRPIPLRIYALSSCSEKSVHTFPSYYVTNKGVPNIIPPAVAAGDVECKMMTEGVAMMMMMIIMCQGIYCPFFCKKLVQCTEVCDVNILFFDVSYMPSRSVVYCCTGYLVELCIWLNLVKIGCESSFSRHQFSFISCCVLCL